jgi:DNA repair exonuclease SbcCD ATPase subunit
MLERALGQSEQVESLNAELDAAFKGQAEQTRVLASIESKVAEVQALHTTVLARSAEISAQQQKLDEAERKAAGELATLREEMRASTERFEFENRSLDATSERIAELRGILGECETRVAGHDRTAQIVSETETRSQALASQVSHLTEDITRISAQSERLRAVRDDVGALDEKLRTLLERSERVDAMRPTIDDVARELATLSGARENGHRRSGAGQDRHLGDGTAARDARVDHRVAQRRRRPCEIDVGSGGRARARAAHRSTRCVATSNA